jgi:hypothetical protein
MGMGFKIPGIKNCPKCKHGNPDTNKFCGNCRFEFTAAKTQQVTSSQAAPAQPALTKEKRQANTQIMLSWIKDETKGARSNQHCLSVASQISRLAGIEMKVN